MTIMKQNTPSGRRNSPAVVFYLFFAAVPLVLLFPSLNKDWALLDDPDMMTYSIRGGGRHTREFRFYGAVFPGQPGKFKISSGFLFLQGDTRQNHWFESLHQSYLADAVAVYSSRRYAYHYLPFNAKLFEQRAGNLPLPVLRPGRMEHIVL